MGLISLQTTRENRHVQKAMQNAGMQKAIKFKRPVSHVLVKSISLMLVVFTDMHRV